MYLIVGLGNPEKDYANTRHNMGFNVINEIAKNCDIKLSQFKFKGEYGKGIIEGEKVILLKPQTYMNLSGESIIQFKNFYKIENEKIIIIYDDIDTPLGKIRIRKKGGPGTHNGMKSVIQHLSTDEFTRVRIGIGAQKVNEDIIEYVLGNIPEDERKILEQSVKKGAQATIEAIKNGVDIAMNKFN